MHYSAFTSNIPPPSKPPTCHLPGVLATKPHPASHSTSLSHHGVYLGLGSTPMEPLHAPPHSYISDAFFQFLISTMSTSIASRLAAVHPADCVARMCRPRLGSPGTSCYLLWPSYSWGTGAGEQALRVRPLTQAQSQPKCSLIHSIKPEVWLLAYFKRKPLSRSVGSH